MDINHCIDHLGLNRNTYRLNQTPPPHEFVSWDGPDPQPTQEELEVAWVEAQQASDADAIAKKNKLDSVRTKLSNLGLTTEEVKEAFNI
tara:strand:- start:278 stop:544 length:267 start_codon:yes stop_codon:yes gene_type:complete